MKKWIQSLCSDKLDSGKISVTYIILYAIPILLLIPVFIFRDYTPNNELRYLSIIDEAINDGSVFVFHNHGVPYADKPPLYFWFMMIGRIITGEHALWFYGIVNMVSAFVIMLVMDKFVSRYSSKDPLTICAKRKITIPAAYMMITSALILGSVVIVRMDLMMTMFLVLSMYSFYNIYSGHNVKRNQYLFPLYVFLAIFSKGAVGILMPLAVVASFLTLQGKFKTIGKYIGWRFWLVLLLICTAWFTAIFLEGGKEYLNSILFKQTVGRGVNSFHHKAPFYYYLKVIWYSLAPWCLFYFFVTIKIFKERFYKQNELVKFFLTIFVSMFVVMSLVSSKVEIYMLPAYPFLIYALMIAFRKVYSDSFKWILIVSFSLLGLAAAIGFSILINKPELMPLERTPILYITVLLLAAGMLCGILLLGKSQYEKGIVVGALTILTCVFIGSFEIPRYNAYIGLGDLSEEMHNIAEEKNIDTYCFYNFRGENMEVYLDKDLALIDTKSELDSMVNTGRGFVYAVKIKALEKTKASDVDLVKQLYTYPCLEVGKYRIITFENKKTKD